MYFHTNLNGCVIQIDSKVIGCPSEGDKIAVRFEVTRTHKGELQGIPATIRKVSFSVIDILKL